MICCFLLRPRTMCEEENGLSTSLRGCLSIASPEKIKRNKKHSHPHHVTFLGYCVLRILLFSDIDECSSPGASTCDPNAICNNTEGSYLCQCLDGYEGDGRNCKGRIPLLVFLFSGFNFINFSLFPSLTLPISLCSHLLYSSHYPLFPLSTLPNTLSSFLLFFPSPTTVFPSPALAISISSYILYLFYVSEIMIVRSTRSDTCNDPSLISEHSFF